MASYRDLANETAHHLSDGHEIRTESRTVSQISFPFKLAWTGFQSFAC